MRIEDIRDHASFKAWLAEQQNAEVVAAVSARAALRLQPLVWVQLPPVQTDEGPMWPSTWWSGLALAPFWKSLASAVAAKLPTDRVETVRRDAAGFLDIAYSRHSDELTEFADRRGLLAAETAGHAANPERGISRTDAERTAENFANAKAAADTAGAHGGAARSAATGNVDRLLSEARGAAREAVWKEVQRDCSVALRDKNVWTQSLAPDGREISEAWVTTRDAWLKAGAPWDRFAKIYDDFWEGRLPDWEFLEQIVLIDPGTWEAGPKAVAEAIAEIDAKTEDDGSTSSTGDLTDAFKRSANAERVVFNEETKKFRLEPLSDLSDSAAADCIEILSNVLMIFDFEDPASNQYRAVQEEWELIRLAVDRYANRPRMLYSTCMRVSRRLTTKFASGECPDPAQDANIGDFHLTIMGVATELRSRDPEVQEALFNAERVNLQPLLARDEEVLEKAVTEVSEISEGALADELPIDLSITLDPSASAEDQRDARLALGGRLIRVFVSCYRGFKASLTEVEQVTKSAAGIATNSARVTAAVGGITMPLWLEKAVAVVQLWF